MNKHWNTLEVLRHARHDWLNRIQLIKGYIALNKVDRVREILDEIIADAHQESKLSNMNIPGFASLLLVYNWENHRIFLEYEVLDENFGKGLTVDDQFLTEWTKNFLDVLGTSVDEDAENYLSITIEPEDQGIRFFFDFRGRIIKEDLLMDYLREDSFFVQKIHACNEQELIIELFLQYATSV